MEGTLSSFAPLTVFCSTRDAAKAQATKQSKLPSVWTQPHFKSTCTKELSPNRVLPNGATGVWGLGALATGHGIMFFCCFSFSLFLFFSLSTKSCALLHAIPHGLWCATYRTHVFAHPLRVVILSCIATVGNQKRSNSGLPYLIPPPPLWRSPLSRLASLLFSKVVWCEVRIL